MSEITQKIEPAEINSETTEISTLENERMKEFIDLKSKLEINLQEREDEIKVLNKNFTSLNAENKTLVAKKASDELRLEKVKELLELFKKEDDINTRKNTISRSDPGLFSDLHYDLSDLQRNLECHGWGGRRKNGRSKTCRFGTWNMTTVPYSYRPEQHRYFTFMTSQCRNSTWKAQKRISEMQINLEDLTKKIATNEKEIQSIRTRMDSNFNQLKALTEYAKQRNRS
jgi:hypothetical protein